MDFKLDRRSRFYKNCKRQRKAGAKICGDCPFRAWIEEQEKMAERKRPPPVKVVRDPDGIHWRLQEPDGTLLPKKYRTLGEARAAARARNAATEGRR